MNEYYHLTLPFQFESEITPVDLSSLQLSSSKGKIPDCQVLNSEKGKFILKKINQTNYLFRVRKFQHKQQQNLFLYKLEFECELKDTNDPQYYFQDFHFETESQDNILLQFKKYIKGEEYSLVKPNVPRDIAKPFCWRGSNFKFNLMKKSIKKNKIGKKNFIVSIKFGEEIPSNGIHEFQVDHQLAQMFQKKPIWLKDCLLRILKSVPSLDESLGKLAFYYYNGPWAKCYVSKQFNPAQNPLAALYQTITIKNVNGENGNSDEEELPQKSYFIIQLCDVQDKEIEKIINETIQANRKNNESKISEKYGWFRRNQLKLIIRKIKSLKNSKFSD